MIRSASEISSRPNSKNCASVAYWNGMSSPSIHAIGSAVALWWACQFQPACGRKSPRRIGTASPMPRVRAAHDGPDTLALDDEAERVLGVPVLGGVFAGVEVLDGSPQGRCRERATAEARVRQGDGPPLAASPDGHQAPGLRGHAAAGWTTATDVAAARDWGWLGMRSPISVHSGTRCPAWKWL